jgi:hypothetical protein
LSSIESAFADGPFGSGVKSEPDKPEPSEPATTTEPRDAASETPEPVKADSGAGARDERDDEDGEGKIDGPPGSEGLQKALKSERSLRREQRKGLSEALKRSEQLEAQNRQFSAQLAAMQQQMAAAAQQQNPQAQEKKPDDWDELLTKGPAYVQERINQAFAERDRKAEAERLEQTKKRVFESRNRLLQREPDAREFLTEFVAMAKADPRLEQLMLAAEDPADYAVQYAKEAKRIAQFNSIDELVAAERAKWEAERAQSGTPAVNGQREATGWSAPKTLAGRRGGGASVTPASGSDTAIESLFRF